MIISYLYHFLKFYNHHLMFTFSYLKKHILSNYAAHHNWLNLHHVRHPTKRRSWKTNIKCNIKKHLNNIYYRIEASQVNKNRLNMIRIIKEILKQSSNKMNHPKMIKNYSTIWLNKLSKSMINNMFLIINLKKNHFHRYLMITKAEKVWKII